MLSNVWTLLVDGNDGMDNDLGIDSGVLLSSGLCELVLTLFKSAIVEGTPTHPCVTTEHLKNVPEGTEPC